MPSSSERRVELERSRASFRAASERPALLARVDPESVDRSGHWRGTLKTSARGSVSAAALAGLLLCAAGCGGSNSPSVARIGTTSDTKASADPYVQARIKWAACIRSHGLPNFPDPNNEGETNVAGININSAAFLAAHQACQSLEVPNPPAVVHQQVKQELAVALCMRKHGVSDFPDPNSQGRIPQTPTANWRTWTSTPKGAKAAENLQPGDWLSCSHPWRAELRHAEGRISARTTRGRASGVKATARSLPRSPSERSSGRGLRRSRRDRVAHLSGRPGLTRSACRVARAPDPMRSRGSRTTWRAASPPPAHHARTSRCVPNGPVEQIRTGLFTPMY